MDFEPMYPGSNLGNRMICFFFVIIILFYSILFYPITLEGRRGTTDEFATIPFHNVELANLHCNNNEFERDCCEFIIITVQICKFNITVFTQIILLYYPL